MNFRFKLQKLKSKISIHLVVDGHVETFQLRTRNLKIVNDQSVDVLVLNIQRHLFKDLYQLYEDQDYSNI